MIDLGTVKPGSTIRIPFSSYDKDDGSSVSMTNYAAADILIYKDGGTTERASTAGFTATTDFDGKTGKHLAVIDLADNTTAGFYNAGSEYLVAVDSVTVDGVTTGGWIARFRIGYPDAHLDTTIASLSSQTSFTLTAGPAEDDALNGCVVLIHDIASAVQIGYAVVSDYTGSTKTVTLTAGVTFTAAAGDNISFFPPGNARWFAALLGSKLPLAPTTAGRDLDVSAGGEAGIDWANIGSPTTAVNLSATNIDVDQVVASVSGAVGSVTGAVGSVTGNVGGNVTGTIGGLTAAALKDFFDTDTTTTYGSAVAGSVVKEIADNAGGSALTEAGIADAVWDELLSGHVVSGSAGEQLAAAGAAGDPWATALPGAYSSGTAGKIIGDNLNATVSSRASQASVDTIDGIVDSILVDTAEIGAAGAGLTEAGGTGDQFTAIPWNASWDAEVQSEATDALNAYDPPTRAEATSDANSILTAVGDVPTNAELATALAGADDVVLAAIAALNNLSAAQVNAEVLDVLNVDTFAQPGQGAPAATTSIRLMLAYLYKAWRNKTDQTATQYSLYNDDAATVDQKAAVSDDATTMTRSEVATGP